MHEVIRLFRALPGGCKGDGSAGIVLVMLTAWLSARFRNPDARWASGNYVRYQGMDCEDHPGNPGTEEGACLFCRA